MTLPPVIRVFFAIDLPFAAKDQLGTFINTLKKKAKSNAIRWTRPENLHITLQFLPEVQMEHLPRLIAEVRQHIQGSIKKSTLKLGAPQLFPNPYRPRVIVLSIPLQEDLAKLAASIGAGIRSADYATEERPFRGHLTLGRLKQPQGVDLHFLAEVMAPAMDPIEMSEAVLFRSEPQPAGSKYTVMERIALETVVC